MILLMTLPVAANCYLLTANLRAVRALDMNPPLVIVLA